MKDLRQKLIELREAYLFDDFSEKLIEEVLKPIAKEAFEAGQERLSAIQLFMGDLIDHEKLDKTPDFEPWFERLK